MRLEDTVTIILDDLQSLSQLAETTALLETAWAAGPTFCRAQGHVWRWNTPAVLVVMGEN